MSDNNNAPNLITIPILVAFILSTAFFSCFVTLLVTLLVLQRRRRLKRRKALLRVKRKTQLLQDHLQDPETPPMRLTSMFPPSLVVSPLHNQRTRKSKSSPSSPETSESVGRRGQYTPLEAHPKTPVEMMGSTTWSKEDTSPASNMSPRTASLARSPSQPGLQMITSAVTVERPRTGQ